MKVIRTLIILAVMAAVPLLPLVLAQNNGVPADPAAGDAAAQSALRILSPTAGQLLQQDFVTVRYELANTGISGGSPNYRVRLDGRDAVITTFNEYTFTGVVPGQHTITVELVDANNTPVANARADVHFNTSQPSATPANTPQDQLREASLASDDNLPGSGSALPLLSVIGFGVLLGGIASALKTR